MSFDDRNLLIKKLNLFNNMNLFVFAKTLFKSVDNNFNDELLFSVANVLLNRFFYEYNIDNDISFVKCITNTSLFPCWKNFKEMDLIDFDSNHFSKCLYIANLSLKGNLNDNSFQSIAFHKKNSFPQWAIGLKAVFKIDDFLFYNNCD